MAVWQFILVSLIGAGVGIVLLGGRSGFIAWRARRLVRLVKDVPYLEGSVHPKHRLDLYLPREKRDFPVVHFVHGGYWKGGDKDYLHWLTGLYANLGVALAKRGIGVVVQSYRLLPEVTIDPMIQDVLQGVRWTVGHIETHGGDVRRLFVAGHSAGGHLAALLGVDSRHFSGAGIAPSAIRGYITLGGIFDLVQSAAQVKTALREKVFWRVFGREEAQLRRYSPSSYLRPGLPPFLVLLAEHDYPGIRSQTPGVVERMSELNNPVEFVELPGYSHEGLVLRFAGRQDRISDLIADFLLRIG